jgi:hypothetical protein
VGGVEDERLIAAREHHASHRAVRGVQVEEETVANAQVADRLGAVVAKHEDQILGQVRVVEERRISHTP